MLPPRVRLWEDQTIRRLMEEALHHNAELESFDANFDANFEAIASVSDLRSTA